MKYSFDMNELASLVTGELQRRGVKGAFKVIFHVHADPPLRIEAVAEEVQPTEREPVG